MLPLMGWIKANLHSFGAVQTHRDNTAHHSPANER